MKKYFALGFLLMGLLLLGCTLPGSPNTGGTNGTGGNGGNGGTGGTGSGGTGNSGTGGTGGTGTNGGQTLAGLGYEALIALGTPLECVYSDTQPGGTTTAMNMRIKGNKVRGNGTTTSGGVTQPIAFVSDGTGTVYINVPPTSAQGPMANCQWLKVTSNASTQTNVSTGGIDLNPSDDFTSPTATFQCTPGTFGDEAFTVSGQVCDLNQILNQVYGSISFCDGISDATKKAQCKAQCDAIVDAQAKAQCAAQFQ